MNHRLGWAVAAAFAITAVAILPASATTSPDPVDLTAITDSHLPESKVAPALTDVSGTVTAFVQLDAPSGAELEAQGASPRMIESNAETVADLADDVVPQRATRTPSASPRQVSVTSNVVAGVVVTGEADRVRALAARKDVVRVYRMTPKSPSNQSTDTFTHAVKAWADTGMTGAGLRVGIIDTGIDYTHADFGGPGTEAAYDRAYGERGQGSVPADTYDDTKYLGGRDFAGYDYSATGDVRTPTPDENPIDARDTIGSGHGTHVAGTAGGFGVTRDGSTFRGDYAEISNLAGWRIGPGAAPNVGLYALKVFGDLGGTTTLTLDALDWAADPNQDGDFEDRLDIINLSLGIDGAPADDPENLFIDELAQLGTLTVVSSGNVGDVVDAGGSPGNARSSLTVANSASDTQVIDSIEVTAPDDAAGRYPAQLSLDYAGPDVTAPLVVLPGGSAGCTEYSATERAAVAGKIVYLWWDDDAVNRECNSPERFDHAQAAGAVGVLLSSGLDTFPAKIAGNTGIPGAQLTRSSDDALTAALWDGTAVVTLSASGRATDFVTGLLADTLDTSSSRGVHGSLGIIKPDVAAPGTDITSAAAGHGTAASTMTGTSMAAPHVAGIAALVRQAHPEWTPAQIKAAVMNTAGHDVLDPSTEEVYGPGRVGAGRVDAANAVSTPGLAYATADPALVSVTFGIVPVGATPVTATRQVTVTNESTSPITYRTEFDRATSTGSATITATPATITVPARGSSTLTLTLNADPATLAKQLDPTTPASSGVGPARDYLSTISGRLILTGPDDRTLRIPVQAAPRPVSELTTQPVAFAAAATQATLEITGRGVNSGGWTALVAPFELKATSPALATDAAPGVPRSVLAAADLRAVGFTSTAPQLAAAGKDPATGTIGIGMAMAGEWASLGLSGRPAVQIDVDSDGSYDFETQVTKYAKGTDLTVAVTYSLKDWTAPNGVHFRPGQAVVSAPVNSVWGTIDTSVFDNNVVVVPVPIGQIGIKAAVVPTFRAVTYTDYLGLTDVTPAFKADPFAPPVWFTGTGNLLYAAPADTTVTVNRSPGTVSTKILVLSMHNATPASRWQTVDVTATPAAAEVPLSVTAQTRCLTGKVTLTVSAVNDAAVPASITMNTPYGPKSFTAVAPKSTAFQSFTTRAATVTSGSVTVTGTTTVDGKTLSSTYTEPFAGLACG